MPPLSRATREILWNISHAWVLYLALLVALVVCGVGLHRRLRSWRQGRPDDERLADRGARLGFALKEVLLQVRVRRSRWPALFHSFFFYAFLVLVVTTGVIALDHDLGTSLFRGPVYAALTVAAEMAGVLILAGVLLAVWRRFVARALDLDRGAADAWPLVLLVLLVVTGFAVEGIRIGVAGDPWKGLAPVGALLAPLFSGLGPEAGRTVHALAWWAHALLAALWIATLPYTKFLHLFTLPANAFLAKRKPAGELSRVDLEALVAQEDFDEDDFRLGIGATDDLTWKQRLDLDACVGCGRCDAVCPAVLAGKPLSPRAFIASLKEAVEEVGAGGAAPQGSREIVGEAFEPDFIWHCLTCMACAQACPAFIDHVDTLVEIRRNEVSMRGRADADISRLLRAMEVQGNPFGSQIKRDAWARGLGLPVLGEGDACEVLYWVGCLTTFDEEKQTIAADLAALLRGCGVEVGLLGKAETCCGDPARVCGDENLFQATARAQIDALKSRSFRTLLVSCPHCYNVLENEYPQFGGTFRVVHHSEFLMELVRAGRLAPAGEGNGRTVYHDPCYLGRYQKVWEAPRELVRAWSGGRFGEMRSCRERSLCCGGGGGHFWMDPKGGERINTLRVREAREAGADTVATACPFCLHMLRDAAKAMNLDRDFQVRDIASLLGGC